MNTGRIGRKDHTSRREERKTKATDKDQTKQEGKVGADLLETDTGTGKKKM